MAPSLAAILLLTLTGVKAQQQGGRQKMEAPKWLSDEGKDLFSDIEADDNTHGEQACENREKLLKLMAGKGDPGAAEYRARTLLGLGLCELKKENFPMAKKRLDSSISEMNLPSEDFMLQNPSLAPIALTKQAADFLKKYELTQAGTQLRRCRELLDRNVKKILKEVVKQMGQGGQAPPLEKFVEEIPGMGKTGQFMPSIIKQVPMLRESFGFMEVIEKSLDSLDKKMSSADSSQKDKKLRLDTSKSKGKTGSLLYARAVFTDPVAKADRMSAATELVEGGATKELTTSADAIEKGMTLIKRTKQGSGCKDVAELCSKLSKIADIQTNGFGETRIIVAKDKKQALDACTTNVNIGIVVAAKDGAQLMVSGQDAVDLKAGEPVVYDMCLGADIEAAGKVPVLVAQAWHPEFAAVERTTEIRARSKSFGLSEDDVKSVTKVINDHAKKSWEKNAKKWRAESPGLESIRESMASADKAAAKASEDAEEAKRKEDEANDDERKKALEELEKKRAEKKKREMEAEEKRQRREKMRQEERAKRDPWLNSPIVAEAEKKIEELKEARRDANAKLEFDLSTSLTKDIGAAERALKKAIKKAKKEFKKGGGVAPETEGDKKEKKDTAEKKDKKDGKDSSKATSELKAKLEEVRKKKQAASEAEDFKEAKKLKAEEKELEAKLKKLEL
eukprot:TRINITY_DN104849_c0_g1_i1.p1 TRINITY_DN104849_c0_g1~~TRINITY_DN104849_c0_g1_i1.p1  ORF type:complete len:678 (-),score=221.65 TRINITY_DN104849_c0_g1_i1:43-2076(-)